MVGLINLFIYILKFPALPSAQLAVALLDVITGHFGQMEVVTSSELRFTFAREAAALAHATVKKAKEMTFASPALPSLVHSTLPVMNVDALEEVSPQLNLVPAHKFTHSCLLLLTLESFSVRQFRSPRF